jgi:rod shape-determining protein MreB
VSRDLAIDLGTANTLVYARGQGIILNEPTVIAMNTRTHEVLALGHDAWQMIGRTPGYIVAVRPLRGGAITDFEITQRLIRMLFQRAGISRLQRARVLICVPSAITHVEQRAVLEAARRAGAAQTFLIEQPMAAAIGASLPIHEPLGNMVVDIGGGTSEVAVISLGGVVALEAVRVGSFDIDAAIQSYVRREYGLAIGERTAEEVKLAIGCSNRKVCAAPARRAASSTARCSTGVMADGTQISTRARCSREMPARWNSMRMRRCVISKSVIAPPRRGRTATM